MAKEKNTPVGVDPQRVVTGKVRASYVYLDEPRVYDNGDEKYSVTLLSPKSDKATYKKLNKAMDAAEEAWINTVWKGKRPAKINRSLHDGDGVRAVSGEPYGEECKGHWVLSVQSKRKPGVVDRDNDPFDAADIKSGDYIRASLRAFAYDVSGNRGVSFGLNNVQFLHEGDPLGGGTSARADFSDPFEDDEDDYGDLID